MDTDRRRTANRRVRLYVAALAVALLTIIGGSPASATSPGRTKGDAQAVFNALMGALYATSALNPQGTPHGTPEGAPGEGIPPGSQEDVRILPIQRTSQSASFCASGWHVISLPILSLLEDYEDYNDLVADLSLIDIQFVWDGLPLEEQRTAIKRYNHPIFDDAFGFNTGAFMPPGSLTVGTHTLTTTLVDPPEPPDTWSIEVIILPC